MSGKKNILPRGIKMARLATGSYIVINAKTQRCWYISGLSEARYNLCTQSLHTRTYQQGGGWGLAHLADEEQIVAYVVE